MEVAKDKTEASNKLYRQGLTLSMRANSSSQVGSKMIKVASTCNKQAY